MKTTRLGLLAACLVTSILSFLPSSAQRVQNMPAITGAEVDPSDLLWLTDVSAGVNSSKKITLAELVNVSAFKNDDFLTGLGATETGKSILLMPAPGNFYVMAWDGGGILTPIGYSNEMGAGSVVVRNNDGVLYSSNDSNNGITGVSNIGVGVYGSSNNYFGVSGSSGSGAGVFGTSSGGNGVEGSVYDAYGVRGSSTNSYGVYGTSTTSTGVYGASIDQIGTAGDSVNGIGLFGYSSYGIGLQVLSSTGTYHAKCGDAGDDVLSIERVNGTLQWTRDSSGAAGGPWLGRFSSSGLTGNRDWNLPDVDGVVALDSTALMLSGGTMGGDIDMQNNSITNISTIRTVDIVNYSNSGPPAFPYGANFTPTAVAGLTGSVEGSINYVTDALAPAVGSTVAAGGSAKCLVCYNGTVWKVIALL